METAHRSSPFKIDSSQTDCLCHGNVLDLLYRVFVVVVVVLFFFWFCCCFFAVVVCFALLGLVLLFISVRVIQVPFTSNKLFLSLYSIEERYFWYSSNFSFWFENFNGRRLRQTL